MTFNFITPIQKVVASLSISLCLVHHFFLFEHLNKEYFEINMKQTHSQFKNKTNRSYNFFSVINQNIRWLSYVGKNALRKQFFLTIFFHNHCYI